MVRLTSVGLVVLFATPLFAADPDARPQVVRALRPGDGSSSLPKARWPQLRYSVDGKTITRIGGDTAIIWDAATGKELERLLPAKLQSEGAPGTPLIADMYPRKLAARSPDGKAVVTYSNPTVQQMQFTLTMTVDGKPWPSTGLEQRMVGVLQLAFTPDGRYALAQLDQEHLHIWDVTGEASGGTAITFATPGPSGYRQVPLMHPAPDSRRVALVEADPKAAGVQRQFLAQLRWRLGVYELDTRRRTGGMGGAGVLTAVDWATDGTRIGGAGRMTGPDSSGEVGFAFVATDDGTFVLPPVELPRPATACALSPDGRTLAVGADGEVQLFEARTGRVRHTFKPDGGSVSALRFHPTGRTLLSETAEGAVLEWDVRGDRAALPEPDAAALDRLWADLDSPDADKAFQAIRLLAAHPARALTFLKGKVAGEVRPSAAEINGRVADLTSRAYAERNAAEARLRAMGMIAHPALKLAMASDPSPELHARAGRLLAATTFPATVRTTRLVEAVELMGTPEARELLAKWVASAGPELTAEATGALRRARK